MTIIIDTTLTKKEIQARLENLKIKSKSVGLRKHFGKSKKKTDAIKFQKEVRNEWN